MCYSLSIHVSSIDNTIQHTIKTLKDIRYNETFRIKKVK